MSLPQVDIVHAAVSKLAQKLEAVGSEMVPIDQVVERVLAAPLMADRDSPALDVSAMDGYAVRLDDIGQASLPVQATTPAGSPPTTLQNEKAVRVFTGAPVPEGADCVIKREDTDELEDRVVIRLEKNSVQPGLHIRRKGENVSKGEMILPVGARIDSAAMAAVASFAGPLIKVRRRLRVSLLNTGDELAQPGESVEDWQIRDSNGPTLQAWISGLRWIELIRRNQVGDRLSDVEQALSEALSDSDAVLLTGGVSMGDADFVPEAIGRVGGSIEFHRLPIRPGRPVLGAHRDGKLILGLPGNPVSVSVTSRVIGQPLLNTIAGIQSGSPSTTKIWISDADDKRLDLVWYRLVQLQPDGAGSLIPSRGSGDLVSLSKSHGFVEIPSGQCGCGPWPFFSWN